MGIEIGGQYLSIGDVNITDNVLFSVFKKFNFDSVIDPKVGITEGGDIHVYSVPNYTLEETLTDAPNEAVGSVGWSQTNGRLAFVDINGDAFIYDTENWTLEETISLTISGETNTPRWSNANDLLAIPEDDDELYIYETDYWTQEKIINNNDGFSDVSWSPEDDYLAGATGNNVVIYETNNWSEVESVKFSNNSHSHVEFENDSLDFSTCAEQTFAVYQYDGGENWSLAQDEKLTTSPQDCTSISYRYDNKRVVVSTDEGDVYVYDSSNDPPYSTVQTINVVNDDLVTIDHSSEEVSSDDRFITADLNNNTAYIYGLNGTYSQTDTITLSTSIRGVSYTN